MKYYKLKQNFHKYGNFFKDVIYPETFISIQDVSIITMVDVFPDDWVEVIVFKFGKGYIYE